MPSSSLSVEMTGEEAKLFQSFQNVIRQASSFEKSLDKSGQAAKGLAREERAMAREAKRAFEEARPPLERYNQKKQQLQSLLERGKITQGEYNAAVRRSKQEMDQAATSGEKAFGPQAIGWAKGLAGALGITGGVAGAVQLVRGEWQQLLEVQREAAGLGTNVAQAQEAALANLGATTAAQRDRFTTAATQLASSLGVSEVDVYARLSDALSARGDKPIYGQGGAIDAVRASFGFAPGDTSAGIAASGAALDIGSITGASAPEALGFLQAVGQKARITSPREQAVNMPPALRAAIANGADPQTAGALYATLTQGMGDTSGRQSKTATIQFSRQLREFAGGDDWAGLGMGDRIARLQQDAAMRESFLADASFEAAAITPVEELLGGGGAQQMFGQFRQELPGMAASGRNFARTVEINKGAKFQQVAALERRFKSAVERLATADPNRMAMGVFRDNYAPLLKQAGFSKLATQLSELEGDLRGGTVADFEAQLRGEAEGILVRPRLGGPMGAMPRGEPSAAEKAEAKVLLSVADAVEGFREAAGDMRAAAGELKRAAEAGPAMVAPGEDR